MTGRWIITSISTHNILSMDTPSQLAASSIDQQLLASVAKGEHSALGQLYDQSSTVLFSLASRILGNREEAADLLQEIYLDVWKKVVRYDVGRGTPISWLITLTRNRALDRVRTRVPRTLRQVDASIDEVHTSRTARRDSDSFDVPADQELRNLIRAAWENLPRIQQQAIERAYYEGLPDTEIAAQLNVSVEAVRNCIALGMSQLHQSLQSDWQQREAV